MQIIPSRDARNRFGEMIDIAQRELITIERNGRGVAVVMSLHDFHIYQSMEEELWELKAHSADKGEYLSVEESESFLKNV
jgi:antitoxin Phd